MSLDVLDWRRRVAELYSEVRGDVDPVHGWARWRTGREDLLRQHPASPVPPRHRQGFRLDLPPYDADLRLEAEVEPGPPQRIEVATATDGVVPFDRIGRVRLGGLGTLDVWWLGSYGGGVWLPVRDPHPASYGGGRYVLDTVKGADLGGRAGERPTLVVDLNFSYNPSCAYDPSWACPLAPEGNRLQVPVPVGEPVPAWSGH